MCQFFTSTHCIKEINFVPHTSVEIITKTEDRLEMFHNNTYGNMSLSSSEDVWFYRQKFIQSNRDDMNKERS